MNEPRMADAIRAGKDIHQANADAWGVTRSKAKNGIFAVNYGSMAKTLSKTINSTEQEAQQLLDSINNGMPAIQKLKEMVWGYTRRNNGTIYDLFGHKLTYPNINSENKWERLEAERQVFNALIQSGAGAIFKELTLRAFPLLKTNDSYISFVVHDEMGVLAPTNIANDVAHKLTKVFCANDILAHEDWHVPVTAEFHVGRNWNEAKNA